MKTKLQQKYDAFVAYFEEHMPIAESELHYKDPYQLLVAVILSAQCTDKRVNMQLYADPVERAVFFHRSFLLWPRTITGIIRLQPSSG